MKNTYKNKYPQLAAALALGLAMFAANPAPAALITPTNYDTIVGSVGAVVGSASGNFQFGATALGSLDTTVYFDGSIYTYEHFVTALTPSVSEFNSLFNVLGFNGVAGWSYTDAAAAGSPGDGSAFTIDQDPDGSIDFETSVGGFGFGGGEQIRLFFQSSAPPRPADYGIINGGVDSTQTLGPTVPEPSAVLLLGSSLLAIGLIRKRFRP